MQGAGCTKAPQKVRATAAVPVGTCRVPPWTWLFTLQSSPRPCSPYPTGSERVEQSLLSSARPQIGQAEGGLKPWGRKETSTLSLHSTQMSPRVTTAFAHCE